MLVAGNGPVNPPPRLGDQVDELRRQIEALIRDVHELHDDEPLRLDMIEAETNAIELLTSLEEQRRRTKRQIDGLDSDLDKMKTRLARFERQEEKFRELILSILQSIGVDRVVLPKSTLSIRR